MKYKPQLYTNIGITNEFDEFVKRVSIFVERYNEEELRINDVNIWVDGCEPPELSHNWFNPSDIINNHEKFDLILTRDPQILENCHNSHVFPFGGIMVESLLQEQKKDKISFLCGHKNFLPGHSLRHSVLNNKHMFEGNMDLDFHYSIGRKHDIFKDSKYSIVVENTQHENYFTEKIVDCLLSKTIPIYWGCPNINEYFNMKSIMTFNNIEELSNIIKQLDFDYYDNNNRNINDNFIRATNYSYYYTRVSNIIKHYLL